MSFNILKILDKFESTNKSRAAKTYVICGHLFYLIGMYFYKETNQNVFFVLIQRCVISMCLNILIFSSNSGSSNPRIEYYIKNKRTLYIVLIQSFLFALETPMFQLAYKYLKLTDAQIISQSSGIFSQFAAFLMLKEEISKKRLLHLTISSTGVICIIRPPMIFSSEHLTENHFIGSFYMLISAAILTVGFMFVKLNTTTISAQVNNQYFYFVMSLVCVLICIIFGVEVPVYDLRNTFYVFGMTIFVYVCVFLMFKANSMHSFAQLAVYHVYGILWSLIIDFLVYGNTPDFISWCGIILVSLALYLQGNEKLT